MDSFLSIAMIWVDAHCRNCICTCTYVYVCMHVCVCVCSPRYERLFSASSKSVWWNLLTGSAHLVNENKHPFKVTVLQMGGSFIGANVVDCLLYSLNKHIHCVFITATSNETTEGLVPVDRSYTNKYSLDLVSSF